MIERKFVMKNKKEFQIQEYISQSLKGVGHSHTVLKKTPLGEKVIIHASRPGLIVGRGGATIKKLTKTLKTKFQLENPQIEISEVDSVFLDANILAERIANSLERFGSGRFKGIMHRSMSDVMNAHALGVEIILSGRIPGARAKTWRVASGYLKKCGDIAITGVRTAHTQALLKSGIIGIKVKIMPPNLRLPDDIRLREDMVQDNEEERAEEPNEERSKDASK